MGEFTVPLVLTTPLMSGQRVKDCQWLLSGHNRFEGLATYKDGDIDGQYGLLSAQATKRAKFWVGYPSAACNGSFGQTLYEYLRPEHWRPLPALYRERREQRLAAAAETVGGKALTFAHGEIGEHEDPWGSNRQKYGVWYRMNGVAWCCIFDSYCLAFTGWTKFRYAYVPAVVDDARYARNGLRIVRTPQRGDLCSHTVHGEPNAHISFFDAWINEAAGTFYDVGGNTGPSSISNGGAVMRQVRYVSNITHFIRIN